MTEQAFSLRNFETPEEIRARIGKTNTQEFGNAFSKQGVAGLFKKFVIDKFQGDNSEDLSISKAKRRQGLLEGVDFSQPESLLRASRAATEANDPQMSSFFAMKAREFPDTTVDPRDLTSLEKDFQALDSAILRGKDKQARLFASKVAKASGESLPEARRATLFSRKQQYTEAQNMAKQTLGLVEAVDSIPGAVNTVKGGIRRILDEFSSVPINSSLLDSIRDNLADPSIDIQKASIDLMTLSVAKATLAGTSRGSEGKLTGRDLETARGLLGLTATSSLSAFKTKVQQFITRSSTIIGNTEKELGAVSSRIVSESTQRLGLQDIPPQAIKALLDNPSMSGQFDQHYGRAVSQRILQGN